GTFRDSDTRWRAVETRARSADGRFVFAVHSTGVYCRPSCPAKRPRRDGVTFYGAPHEAEAAGYRACKRCEPREALAPGVRKGEAGRRVLERHLDENVTLGRPGREGGLT